MDCGHHLVPTLVEVFTIDQRGKSESQPLQKINQMGRNFYYQIHSAIPSSASVGSQDLFDLSC